MGTKTISQIRLDVPSVTLAPNDLIVLDQSTKTVAAKISELKEFVKPSQATPSSPGLMTSDDKQKLDGIAQGATANSSDSDLLNRTNHTGSQSIGTITGLGSTLASKVSKSTGVIYGLNVTPAASQKFNIGAGIAVFTTYSDPKNPTSIVVDFQGLPNVSLSNLATSNQSYIGLLVDGSLVQQVTPFTPDQLRTIVQLAAIWHPNRTAISAIQSNNRSINGEYNNLQDLADAIGTIKVSGGVFTLNNDMTMARTTGTIFNFNGIQSRTVFPAASPVSFIYRHETGAESGSATTTINPESWSNAGAIAVVDSGKWTVQTVLLHPTGNTIVLYGSQQYNTCGAAIASISTNTNVVSQDIADSIKIGHLVVQQGCTNLQNVNKCVFVTKNSLNLSGQLLSEFLTNQIVLQAIGYTPANANDVGVKIDKVLRAALPTASAHKHELKIVTDANGGPKLVMSDGTDWMLLNTSTPVN